MLDLYSTTDRLVTIHASEQAAKDHAAQATADGCPTRAYKRTIKLPIGTVVVWMTAERGA